jgi:hypothetical protein
MKYFAVFTSLIFVFVGYHSISKNGLPAVEKESTYQFSADKVVATWNWTSVDTYTREEMDHVLAQAKSSGIQTIYQSIDRYIDIIEQPQTEEKQLDLEKFETSLHAFLESANRHGIKVHALSGNTNWANDSHQYLPILVIDYVKQFNQKNQYQFTGIHFDIEFYNQKDYIQNLDMRNAEWLTLMDEIAEQTREGNLEIGYDLASWLDTEQNNIKPIMNEILNKLASHPQSFLVLMAYRNTAEGNNGIIESIEGEINYLHQNNLSVPIIIGQETDKNEDTHITYYGMSKKDVAKQSNKTLEYFKNYPQVKGIAIHHLQSFLELE